MVPGRGRGPFNVSLAASVHTQKGSQPFLIKIPHLVDASPLQLPTAIGALASLRLLDVSHNMLTKLPSSVGDLELLKSLKVGAKK